MTTDRWIVRPAAEVATKSRRTRSKFERRLRDNLAAGLARAGATWTMRQDYGRLYLDADAGVADALERLFGAGSYSRIEATCPPVLEDIVATGREAFAERVQGRTYAVRAKRLAGHPFSAQDVNVALGAALNPGATVHLDDPDVTVYVEIGVGECHLFTGRWKGAGGLPVGTAGRAVTLLSGGFDSAVAAWRMLRRGAAVDYVLCNLGGGASERLVLHVAKVLNDVWGTGYNARLFVVEFEDVLAELRRAVRTTYWQIVLKRLMLRAASAIARDLGAEAIITGEAVGQVSSQTLSNLRSIDPAAAVPVLRPLIGFDKQEIIDEARRIGTAAISRRVKEYCAIVPGRPATYSRAGHMAHEEAKMDSGVLARAIAAVRVIDLSTVTATDLRTPYLYTGQIPAGAAVIDCRPALRFDAWHVPGAQNRDPLELMDNLGSLDKARTYVVYCTHGAQSAGVAEVLQQSGFEAYAFQGGIDALKRYVSEHAAP